MSKLSNPVRSERILAQNTIVSNNTHYTGLNNNDLIIGPSGCGKTRGYVIPNILHSEDSLIIADTKGNLCRLYGDHLREQGYNVLHINFSDLAKSDWGYNPLHYIRKSKDEKLMKRGDFYNEQDVKKIAACLCPIECMKEPFWDFAARMYLETFILYVMNALPEKEQNLCEVNRILSGMDTSEIRFILDEERISYPDSAFTRKYNMVLQNKTAEKMDASIKGILAQHLDVVSYSSTERLFRMKNQVRFENFLKEKTALFLTISDSDRSQDALINLFYTQALQFLLDAADKQPDSRLPIPVRFILDDFSTNTVIPDFDKIISVIRSREIYVSLIVQSLSQLEGLYEHAKAQTIINNCDHCLYLGGTDTDTARYFALKFNCQPATILNMPLDCMFLFTRGSQPVRVKRYELEEDKTYRGLAYGSEELNDDSEWRDTCEK